MEHMYKTLVRLSLSVIVTSDKEGGKWVCPRSFVC